MSVLIGTEIDLCNDKNSLILSTGSERAALHLPEDAPSWSVNKPQESSVAEYSEASELDTEEGKESPAPTEQPEESLAGDSDEHFKATIRDLQKA